MLVSRNFSGEWLVDVKSAELPQATCVFSTLSKNRSFLSFLLSFLLSCFILYFVSLHCTLWLHLTLTVETHPDCLELCLMMCVTWGQWSKLSLVKAHGLTLVLPNGMLLCPIVGRQHTSPAAPTTSTAALAQEGMCGEGTLCLSVCTLPACLARGRMVCPERTDSHCTHSDRRTDRQTS